MTASIPNVVGVYTLRRAVGGKWVQWGEPVKEGREFDLLKQFWNSFTDQHIAQLRLYSACGALVDMEVKYRGRDHE